MKRYFFFITMFFMTSSLVPGASSVRSLVSEQSFFNQPAVSYVQKFYETLPWNLRSLPYQPLETWPEVQRRMYQWAVYADTYGIEAVQAELARMKDSKKQYDKEISKHVKAWKEAPLVIARLRDHQDTPAIWKYYPLHQQFCAYLKEYLLGVDKKDEVENVEKEYDFDIVDQNFLSDLEEQSKKLIERSFMASKHLKGAYFELYRRWLHDQAQFL